jgi:copper(I)-binding protein
VSLGFVLPSVNADRGRRSIAAVAVLVAASCGGGGTDVPAVVADAWAIPTGDGSAVVYATITAPTEDELTGARVDRGVARRAELVNPDATADDGPGHLGHLGHLDPGGSLNDDHSHTVALRADTPVTLEPSRAHIALDVMATPLSPGDTFEITLTFDDGPDVAAEVTVRAPDGPSRNAGLAEAGVRTVPRPGPVGLSWR